MQTMETIKTEIEWRKPEHEAPPFNTKILVMLGGASGQIGMPLKPGFTSGGRRAGLLVLERLS